MGKGLGRWRDEKPQRRRTKIRLLLITRTIVSTSAAWVCKERMKKGKKEGNRGRSETEKKNQEAKKRNDAEKKDRVSKGKLIKENKIIKRERKGKL